MHIIHRYEKAEFKRKKAELNQSICCVSCIVVYESIGLVCVCIMCVYVSVCVWILSSFIRDLLHISQGLKRVCPPPSPLSHTPVPQCLKISLCL